MATAVATMPSSTASHATTDSNHTGRSSDPGPRGFTAVNGNTPQSTPPTSRENSPRYSNTGDAPHSPEKNGVHPHTPDQTMHKRKRSDPSDSNVLSPRRYDYNPPKRTESHQHLAGKALHVLDSAQQPPFSNSYYSTTPNGSNHHPMYNMDRPYNGVHEGQHAIESDEHNQREGSDHSRYRSHSDTIEVDTQDRTGDDGGRPSYASSGSKRKRNFSNRTKTGCMTCRQRKKKCDEGRPTCNNCQRGGFECQGYSNTRPGTWTNKPAATKQPVPLQSKENDGQYSYRTESESTPVSAHPSTHEASQLRSAPVENHEQLARPAYTSTSQQPPDGRPPYHGQPQPQWPHPPPPQQQGQLPPTYTSDHLPPFSELARSEPQRSDYPHPPSRDMSRPNTQPGPPPPSSQGPPPPQWQQTAPPPPPPHSQQHQQSAPPPPAEHRYPPYQPPPRIETQQQQQQHQQPPQPPPQTYPQPIQPQGPPPPPPSRMPSRNYQPDNKLTSSKNFSKEEVERSRMHRNVPYNRFDPTLTNERQRCAQALKRYNNACELGSGISEEEAKKMLNRVINPSLDKGHSFLAPCPQRGTIGTNVIIEAPFKCTYGYNLTIWDHVYIGEGTRIDDSAEVYIGARTWIGNNVEILTNDVAKDIVQRKGTEGQKCIARAVEIAAEVVIGDGAKIYPGVKIGRGATVEPYAVVYHSLLENQTQKPFMGAIRGSDPSASQQWERSSH